jgi:two-component system phosphate regulon sensor histidine kinase PhoR
VGDRTCLTVLFDNLVTNALDYNRPGGSVTVSASQTGGEVVVEVRDTGVGIPEEALGLLFEEFYRVGPGPSGSPGDGPAPSAGGTGLGLPICRRIASELGGLIEVRSEVDVGSTFVVRLPAHPTSGEPEVEPGVAESEVPA